MAINRKILPWDPKYLLESLRACFMDAMGCVTTTDDILMTGQAKLHEALEDTGKWPVVSKCSDNDIGFVKAEHGRKRYVADIHAFRNLFEDENQARMVVRWLHDKGVLKFSQGARESLEAAIWKGTTPKWPNRKPYRSYQFFSPF